MVRSGRTAAGAARAILSGVTTPAAPRPAAPGRPATTRVLDLVDLDPLERAADLLAEVWRSPQGHPPMPADLLRALAHTGGYVSGAYLDGLLAGVSVGS